MMQLLVYMLLAAERRVYLCKSITIEMRGVSLRPRQSGSQVYRDTFQSIGVRGRCDPAPDS